MDIAIAEETLGAYKSFVPERDSLDDYQQGKADGQREYPPTHQTTFSAHELARISEARAALNKYTRRLREAFDRIQEKITARLVERDTEYNSRKESLVEQKNSGLATLKQIFGPASGQWQETERNIVEATRSLQEQEFRVGRPPRISFAEPVFDMDHPAGRWASVYAVVLTVLAVLEMPINVLGVEMAFEFTPPTSYVVALFIGVTFVMFSHFLGIQLVRAVYPQTRHRLLHIAASVVIIALGMVMIFVLYKMRGQVAGLTGGGLSPASFLNPGAAAPQPVGFWQSILDIIPWRDDTQPGSTKYAQFGLLLLNVMVFVSGTVLSLYRHDPDPDLERSWMAKAKLDRSFRRMRREYSTQAAKIETEFGGKILLAQRRADMVEAEIARLEAEKQRLLQQANNDMRIVLDVLTQQITAYQKGNLEQRKSRAPSYFGHAGLLTLGDNLVIR